MGDLLCGHIPGAYSHGRPLFMPPPRPAARSFRDLLVWRKAHEFVPRRLYVYGGFSEARDVWLALSMRRAACLDSSPYRGGLSPPRQGGQGPLHELGGGITGRVLLLSDPVTGSGLWRQLQTCGGGGRGQSPPQRVRRRHSDLLTSSTPISRRDIKAKPWLVSSRR